MFRLGKVSADIFSQTRRRSALIGRAKRQPEIPASIVKGEIKMASYFFNQANRKTTGKLIESFVRFGFVLPALVLICAAFAHAQLKSPTNPNASKSGEIKGTIFIKNISGNIGNSLRCFHLIIASSQSLFAAQATGDITTGKCSYFLGQVKSDENFVLTIRKPKLFKVCETGTFEVDGMFPQKIKPSETRVINLMIRKAACTQVK
jgi:hypothetical protein